jgi:Sulfotransferase family
MSKVGEAVNGKPRETTDTGTTEPEIPHARHVEQRTVVLPDLRVLYLPMPKAGCTTILWLLAELGGVPVHTFDRSAWPGVSPALLIHDTGLWGSGRFLSDFEGEERERVLTEDGWFRFSVVRDPIPRLWSAWQSKLLLREPRFLVTFGEEPWFPRLPGRPADLIEDFRRFVAAVADGEAVDVHWAVQHDLAEQLPLGHVGRLERVSETLELLREHVRADVWPEERGRENRTPIPLPPHAYDEAAAKLANEHFRADLEHYGYEPARPSDDESDAAQWERSVEPLLPVLRDTIDRHARIGQLHSVARRAQYLEKRLSVVETREIGRANAPELTNLEERPDFNVRWSWFDNKLEPGFTAVVRAKNEALALPWVLPPLLRAVRRVILVDNGSTDGTADIATRVAAELGADDRLEVHAYPFDVARCGEEHLSTPAASLHSLAYFYNWSFSHVRTGYALKWDADMVLTDAAASVLRDLAWQLEASKAVIKIPRFSLYLADERRAFLDVGLTNCEPWAWPNRPGFTFVKAMEWEQPQWPEELPTIVLPEWSCLELKHLAADEFDHWSSTNFDQTARTRRKRREWEVFRALAEGGEPPSEVITVEAPEGRHVIDYVRSTWLPEQAAAWEDKRGILAGLVA